MVDAPSEQKPAWVELDSSNYQEAVSFLHSPLSSSTASSGDQVDDHSSTLSPDGGVNVPPPPPSTPPLTQKQIDNLQALEDLRFKGAGSLELYNYFTSENKEEIGQEEVKESVNDSFLSSAPSASDEDSDYSEDEEEDDEESDSTDGGEPTIYHAVKIHGRGHVAVYRSKRAPKYKLYYFTITHKKAYLTKKHILALKRLEFHMLQSNDPIVFMNSPSEGCLHKQGGNCWCDNLIYYLDELYNV